MGRSRTAASAVPVNRSAEVVPVGRGFVGHVVGHMVGKALPYTPPWVAASTLPPLAGWATNSLWGGAPLSAGLASATLAV
ncbi:hypothetical protein, partial [Streptomyces longwoodensis]|uniref:hypothetical protein n=2 Tax=Streptomyces TaxID=1883 RepID=UPI0033EC5D29